MTTIKIHRSNDYINLLRDYRLYIDGQIVGTISNGQTKDFEITQGRHTLISKIDWCSSPEVSFEINDHDSKKFLVGNFKYARLLIPYVTVIFALSFLLAFKSHFYFGLIFLFQGFIYLLYFITLGRKNYLTLKEL